MNDIEKLQKIADAMYAVCAALVSITENECCSYGFDEIVDMAEKYCQDYEKDHEAETCTGCTHPCIMYEPKMKACDDKGRE